MVHSRFVKNGSSFARGSDVYDIGAIAPGESVDSQVIVWNKGQQVLIIKGIASSCNCTVPSISSSAIPPAVKAVLRVMMSGIFRPGEVQEQVTIVSNDPKNQMRIVSFRGLVDPVLQTILGSLNFDLTQKESLPIRRIRRGRSDRHVPQPDLDRQRRKRGNLRRRDAHPTDHSRCEGKGDRRQLGGVEREPDPTRQGRPERGGPANPGHD